MLERGPGFRRKSRDPGGRALGSLAQRKHFLELIEDDHRPDKPVAGTPQLDVAPMKVGPECLAGCGPRTGNRGGVKRFG